MVKYIFQHYLPKFLSQKFAYERNSLNVYMKNTREIIQRSLKIGAEKYFYTSDYMEEFEKDFAGLFEGYFVEFRDGLDETMSLPEYEGFDSKKIISLKGKEQEREILEQYVQIEKTDYFKLLQFIVFQDMRVKANKNKINGVIDKAAKKWIIDRMEEGEFELTELIKSNQDKFTIKKDLAFFQQVLLSPVKAILLFDLRAVLIFNTTKIPFILGDSPVCKINLNAFTFQPLGYTTRGLFLIFPLDPMYAIILFDPGAYKLIIESDNASVTEDDADLINKCQLQNSNEFVVIKEIDEFTIETYIEKLQSLQSSFDWASHAEFAGDAKVTEFYPEFLAKTNDVEFSFIKKVIDKEYLDQGPKPRIHLFLEISRIMENSILENVKKD